MEVITNVSIDMIRHSGIHQVAIDAKQYDKYTRKVRVSMLAGSVAWNIPEGSAAAIRYRKPDKTVGLYDQLPDGSAAATFTAGSNVLTLTLAPQVLTVAGMVHLDVLLVSGVEQIGTFDLLINVLPAPVSEGNLESQDYYNYSTLAELNNAIGDLAALKTTAKGSLVEAINEVNTKAGDSATGGEAWTDITDAYLESGLSAEIQYLLTITEPGFYTIQRAKDRYLFRCQVDKVYYSQDTAAGSMYHWIREYGDDGMYYECLYIEGQMVWERELSVSGALQEKEYYNGAWYQRLTTYPQTLTEAEKQNVRENIGAAGADVPEYVRTEAEQVAENILSITGESGGEANAVAAYTNLLPTAEALDGTDPYNGTGYKDGYYASSASPYEGADTTCVLTGLIPYDGSYGVAELPSIYVKGATIDTSQSHVRFQLWKEDKTYINSISLTNSVTIETLADSYYKLTFASNIRDTYGAFGYIRMSLAGSGADLIVTAGEPIVTASAATSDAPPVNIAFITDLHYSAVYADGLRHAAQGLSVIKETAQIDAVIYGGDYVNTNAEAELAKSHISTCKQIFAGAAGESVEIWLRGNHDNIPYPDADGNDPRIGRMECYNRTGRKQHNRRGYISNPADPGGNYGYIDLDGSKIRLICLNTADNDHFGIGDSLTDAYHVSGKQLKWIADNALDFTGKEAPTEWGIVVASHVPVCSNDWMDAHSYTDASGATWTANVVNVKKLIVAYCNGNTFDTTVDGVSVTADFTSTTERASFICAISGHQHALTSYTDLGWLTIGCPNASHLRTNENEYEQDADIDGNAYGTTAQEKTAKSATDTAFTVLTIDRAGGKIYAWCYGAGYNRSFSIPQ